jgi:putative FmdB family regulatory protein
MPIYEYRCSACGHKLEALQKISDAPLVGCPTCGKDTLTKLVSAAGFQLKGSGWYATDFKGSGRKPEAKTAEAKNGEGASSESKSEAKTESAAATPAAGCGAKCSCH